MRKIALIIALAFAVVVPAGALAAKPSHPSTPASTNANTHANGTSTSGTSSASSKGAAAKVLFVLRGSITAYTAGTTVSIKVSGSNHESSTLTGQTLMFPVNSSTKIVNTVTVNDRGIVKVRAAKNATSATLQTAAATQVIDQGSSS